MQQPVCLWTSSNRLNVYFCLCYLSLLSTKKTTTSKISHFKLMYTISDVAAFSWWTQLLWVSHWRHLASRLQFAFRSDVVPRGLMGVGVRMDSALPALTRKTKTFGLLNVKKLLAGQTVSPRRDKGERRNRVSVCFNCFITRLTKQK